MRTLRLFTLAMALFGLSGCAAVAAVSVIPGALVDVAASQFGGEERSFPRDMRTTLAAVQSSLHNMKLDIDVLEIDEQGYIMSFGKDELEGTLTLSAMTAQLTTMNVKVRSPMREASVEQSIVESVQKELARSKKQRRFNFAGYNNLRTKPDIRTARLGWYRKQAELDTYPSGKTPWLRIKLPSGKSAFLKDLNIEVASK